MMTMANVNSIYQLSVDTGSNTAPIIQAKVLPQIENNQDGRG
jgi:hypothetical protein